MNTAQIIKGVGHSKVTGRVNRVVKFNIGLENNPRDVETILAMVGLYVDIDRHSVVVGEYIEAEERTLTIIGLTDVSLHVFDIFVGVLCGILTQECIAYKFGGKGVLKYSDNFNGERNEFDEQYFLEI
jgi:hypothetical protein